MGIALLVASIVSIVAIAVLRPRGTCPVCSGVLTYSPVFRSHIFGRLKCPHCRTKLRAKHPLVRWQLALQLGCGIPLAIIWLLALATLNLWLFLAGTIMWLVIATGIEKWQAGWLYRTAVLVRADGKAASGADQQA